MGAKRGRGRGAFVDSVLAVVDSCYANVLGSLRPWAATTLKLRPVRPVPPQVDEGVASSLSSTDFSSQDGAEDSVDDDATEAEPAVRADSSPLQADDPGKGVSPTPPDDRGWTVRDGASESSRV